MSENIDNGRPTDEQAGRLISLTHQRRLTELADYMVEIKMDAVSAVIFYARFATFLIKEDAASSGKLPDTDEHVWAIEADGTPPLAAQLITTMLNDDPDTFVALAMTVKDTEGVGAVVRELIEFTASVLDSMVSSEHSND